jgi:hypothetical protein
MCLYGTEERYWRTFLASFLANRIAFKDFGIRLYASYDVEGHPQARLLDIMTEVWPDVFECIMVPGPYPGKEPSIWRLRPFWDPSVDIFLSRDCDAVPIRQEVVAVRAWLETDLPIHGMRSYHLHTCLLMAGLCGFRNAGMDDIRARWGTFDDMLEEYNTITKNYKEGAFGGDQELLNMLFGARLGDILDTPICTAKPLSVHWNMLPDLRYEAVDMSDVPPALFEITEPPTLSNYGEFPGFSGKPIGELRKEVVSMMERIETPDTAKLKKLFIDHPDIAAYYYAA